MMDNNLEQLYDHQYTPFGSTHLTAPAAGESGVDVIPEDAGPDSVNGSESSSKGHTLDEMVSENHKELQRRRSMRPPYLQSECTELMQTSLMDYSGNDLGGYQFESTQSPALMAGNGTELMAASPEELDFTHQQPPRGSLTLDTQFSSLPSPYESIPSANSYRSHLVADSSVGLDSSTSYVTQDMGSQIQYNHSNLPRLDIREPRPMNIYQEPDYLPVASLAGSGAFSSLRTATRDLPTRISQARVTSEIPFEEEDDLVGLAPMGPGQDLAHIVPKGREVSMQTNAPSFIDSQRSNSTMMSPASQSSAFSNTSKAPHDTGDKSALAYPLPDLRKVKPEPSEKHASTGLDAVDILARVTTRKNPRIDLSGVDITCAFLVCDLNGHDYPIVYVSDNFERLTGYSKREVFGRNCRFLQSPDGNVDAGAERKFVDGGVAFLLKSDIESRSESQVGLINYRKGGQPFMNLLSIIPIRWDSEDYRYCVGFQVDLVEKPQAISRKNPDGFYTVNYQRDQLPRYVFHTPETRKPSAEIKPSTGRNGNNDRFSCFDKVGSYELPKISWEKMLLERSNDVVHVISPKGQFLYLSPSTPKVLEYDVNELVGTAISSICHPSDVISLTRGLRESTSNSEVSLVYRIRRKYSGYAWFECRGSLHIESGTGRKYLVLAGRERPNYDLTKNDILEAGGMTEYEFWTKMSLSGMFLFVSSNVRTLLDRYPEDLVGQSIMEYMRPDSKAELEKALERTRLGNQATFKHEFRHKRGQVYQAETTLYPADSPDGSRPTFLIAQTRLIKYQRTSVITVRKAPASPDVRGTALPSPSNTFGVPKNDQSGASPSLTPTTPSNPRLSGFVDHVNLQDNMFGDLKSTRGTSWQSELRQLEKRNRKLAEELQTLLSRRKKRKRKKGTGPLEKHCTLCNKRDTPEWRRGPSGNRDLCNGCGLKFAKNNNNGRISPRKPSVTSESSEKT